VPIFKSSVFVVEAAGVDEQPERTRAVTPRMANPLIAVLNDLERDADAARENAPILLLGI
jgi:hypothetical protein